MSGGSMREDEGGFRPTKAQGLLLRAAVLSDERALAAWAEWQELVEIDRIDPGSFRLLGLLFRNLSRLGVKDRHHGRLRGVYRKTWYQNRMLFHRMASVLAAFHDAGVRTLILKGTPLTLLHYRDHGVRPMSDFDILVPPSQADRAIEVLSRQGWGALPTPLKGNGMLEAHPGLGWSPRPRDRSALGPTFRAVRHGHAFENARGDKVDLHWRVYERCFQEDADEGIWGRAVPVEVDGVETLAPDATDLLLHVCAHGAAWNPVPPLRWIADAAVILRGGSEGVDWFQFVAEAAARRLVPSAIHCVRTLVELLGSPIPPEVPRLLGDLPVSPADARAFAIESRPPGLAAGVLEIRYLYRRWQDLCRRGDTGSRRLRFDEFLSEVLGAGSVRQVLLYATLEAARRVLKPVVAGASRGRRPIFKAYPARAAP